jgi:hypothetical protein
LQKINLIWLLIVLTAGCSVFKNNIGSDHRLSNDLNGDRLIESIEKQNVTVNSFYIQKAEIEITTESGSEKLLASLKFESPDKYLISIKSRTGIEGLRIFLSRDSVLVNDRINKKVYCGSTNKMNLKYGISFSEIPVILGDFVFDTAQDNNVRNCIDDNMDIDTYLKGIMIKYVIDCPKRKLRKTIITNDLNRVGIVILYSDYFKHSAGFMPGLIQMNDPQRKIKIKIRIRKMESPWDGRIDFIPGKQYEILQLP